MLKFIKQAKQFGPNGRINPATTLKHWDQIGHFGRILYSNYINFKRFEFGQCLLNAEKEIPLMGSLFYSIV